MDMNCIITNGSELICQGFCLCDNTILILPAAGLAYGQGTLSLRNSIICWI